MSIRWRSRSTLAAWATAMWLALWPLAAMAQTFEQLLGSVIESKDPEAALRLAQQAEADGSFAEAAQAYAYAGRFAAAQGRFDLGRTALRRGADLLDRVPPGRRVWAWHQIGFTGWVELVLKAAADEPVPPEVAAEIYGEAVEFADSMGHTPESFSLRAELHQVSSSRKSLTERTAEAVGLLEYAKALDPSTLPLSHFENVVRRLSSAGDWRRVEQAGDLLVRAARLYQDRRYEARGLGLLWEGHLWGRGDRAGALRYLLEANEVIKAMLRTADERPRAQAGAEGRWVWGIHYLGIEHWVEDTLRQLDRASASHPCRGWRFFLGVAAYYRGDLRQAEGLLREALRLPDELPPHVYGGYVRVWLGRVLLAEGQVEAGEAELAKGLAAGSAPRWQYLPHLAQARLSRASGKLQAGEPEQAELLARSALEPVKNWRQPRITELREAYRYGMDPAGSADLLEWRDGATRLEALGLVAAALSEQGKAQEAARAAEQAAALAKQVGDQDTKLWAASATAG
ncbi:MAG: tetratricopeptide repeat protein, partial [Armatimonadota bacterium]